MSLLLSLAWLVVTDTVPVKEENEDGEEDDTGRYQRSK